MNVAPFKSGSRGRPRFRRITGNIISHGSHWVFLADDADLYGGDHIFLSVPLNFPIRAKNCINRELSAGRAIGVTLAFSGRSHNLGGIDYYDCRFVGFPSWVHVQ